MHCGQLGKTRDGTGTHEVTCWCLRAQDLRAPCVGPSDEEYLPPNITTLSTPRRVGVPGFICMAFSTVALTSVARRWPAERWALLGKGQGQLPPAGRHPAGAGAAVAAAGMGQPERAERERLTNHASCFGGSLVRATTHRSSAMKVKAAAMLKDFDDNEGRRGRQVCRQTSRVTGVVDTVLVPATVTSRAYPAYAKPSMSARSRSAIRWSPRHDSERPVDVRFHTPGARPPSPAQGAPPRCRCFTSRVRKAIADRDTS
jgi:hypothetical protein